jgi:hypothetical protein
LPLALANGQINGKGLSALAEACLLIILLALAEVSAEANRKIVF